MPPWMRLLPLLESQLRGLLVKICLLGGFMNPINLRCSGQMQRIGWSPLHIGEIHKLNRLSLLDTFMSHIEAIKQIHDLHGI